MAQRIGHVGLDNRIGYAHSSATQKSPSGHPSIIACRCGIGQVLVGVIPEEVRAIEGECTTHCFDSADHGAATAVHNHSDTDVEISASSDPTVAEVACVDLAGCGPYGRIAHRAKQMLQCVRIRLGVGVDSEDELILASPCKVQGGELCAAVAPVGLAD